MNHLIFILISVLFVIYLPFQAKSQSCCDEDEDVTLCYLSAADYCGNSTAIGCSAYSLDGQYMNNSLLLKLQSPQNFGPNGIVPCNLLLKKLDVIQNAETISDCGCDIVFVPSVSAEDSITGSLDPEATRIPDEVLGAVLEWSQACKENLAIVFQAEADFWGYDAENVNINPNTQVINDFSNTIFNGPFGNITSINQGGSYQGVFTTLPSSGAEILAEDANGRPTIALDLATNDIVGGDIGVFCTVGLTTSIGPEINNDNDIFICNVFALGCQLVRNTEDNFQVIEKCIPELVVLPDGQTTSDFGVFIDTLRSIDGCDSIIITYEIIERVIDPINLNYSGCEDDGYQLIVNDNIYDELNPFGEELVLTNEGCDSLILIDLSFAQAIKVDTIIEMTDFNQSPFDNFIPNDYDILWTPSENLSCSDCPNPLIIQGCDKIYNLQVISDDNTCFWNIDLQVEYDYSVYIPNAFSPNGDGINDHFSLGLPPNLEIDDSFEVKIFNRWGAEMFSSEDLAFRWNGTANNEPLNPGVYVYWFILNCNLYAGDLTLIR